MSDPEGTSRSTPEQTGQSVLREALSIYGGVLAGTLAVVIVGMYVPVVGRNVYALLALLFLGVPYLLIDRRGWDFDSFGLTWRGAKRSILWGLGLTLLTVIPFCFGYYFWATAWLGQDFEFRWANYYRWPVSLRQAPDIGPDDPGIRVWAEGDRIQIRVRSDVRDRLGRRRDANQSPVATVKSEGLAVTDDSGAIDAIEAAPDSKTPAGQLQLVVDGAGESGTVTLGPREGVSRPMEFRIRSSRMPLYAGSSQRSRDGPLVGRQSIGWLWLWVLTQLLFVALPEEYFYRGYLQTRLREVFDARSGDDLMPYLTRSNLATSCLFALGHLVVPVNGAILVNRLGVFFPSVVFGWLREKTGTIAGAVVYHAASNLMVLVAAPHFS